MTDRSDGSADQSKRAHVMMTVRKMFASLVLGGTLLGSAAGAANADQFHVEKVWFSGEGFIVRQVASDEIGARWCAGSPVAASSTLAAFAPRLPLRLSTGHGAMNALMDCKQAIEGTT